MRAEFMDDEAMRRTTVAVQMPEDRRRISLYRVVSLHSAQVCRSGRLKESECCSLRTAIRQTDQHQRTARILPQGGHSNEEAAVFSPSCAPTTACRIRATRRLVVRSLVPSSSSISQSSRFYWEREY